MGIKLVSGRMDGGVIDKHIGTDRYSGRNICPYFSLSQECKLNKQACEKGYCRECKLYNFAKKNHISLCEKNDDYIAISVTKPKIEQIRIGQKVLCNGYIGNIESFDGIMLGIRVPNKKLHMYEYATCFDEGIVSIVMDVNSEIKNKSYGVPQCDEITVGCRVVHNGTQYTVRSFNGETIVISDSKKHVLTSRYPQCFSCGQIKLLRK